MQKTWWLELESIVRDVLPANTYEFQAQINPETTEKGDCAEQILSVRTGIIPIDSKFYQGQYQNYHEMLVFKNMKEIKFFKSFETNNTKADAESISKNIFLETVHPIT